MLGCQPPPRKGLFEVKTLLLFLLLLLLPVHSLSVLTAELVRRPRFGHGGWLRTAGVTGAALTCCALSAPPFPSATSI